MYDAKNIVTMDRVEEWTSQYPGVSSEFIERLVESVWRSGCPADLAERRYLMHEAGIEVPAELVAIHMDLMLKRSRGFGVRL